MSTVTVRRPAGEPGGDAGAEMTSLGASIRTARRDAGLKLREVAVTTGLSNWASSRSP